MYTYVYVQTYVYICNDMFTVCNYKCILYKYIHTYWLALIYCDFSSKPVTQYAFPLEFSQCSRTEALFTLLSFSSTTSSRAGDSAADLRKSENRLRICNVGSLKQLVHGCSWMLMDQDSPTYGNNMIIVGLHSQPYKKAVKLFILGSK